MQKTMQTHAAVFRTEETLKEGCSKMSELYKQMSYIKVMVLINTYNYNRNGK